ncbi:MAG: hypothetical protein ABI147_12075 [Acidobacteriaceae bacterium]
MNKTIQQIDDRIAELQSQLDFYQKAREVVASPLFAALSINHSSTLGVFTLPDEGGTSKKPFGSSSNYGLLKKMVLEFLPTDKPITPQDLADLIGKNGYVFKTRTPAISVNDALQGFRTGGKAKLVGKSSSNAGLWLRDTGTPAAVLEREGKD